MGCVVNGPGEAREADLGVAAGNGKGDIIRRGERIATVREEDIVEAMVHYATEMAEEIRRRARRGRPVVV
jgi:(E)-4-hydroxy-3-methylbut-2-enyl-diphosphate synthase